MDFSEAYVICRLCLKKLTETYEPIGEIVQYTLNFLNVHINLTVSDDPMMCETCAAKLKKCFDFKARCLSSEDCIASFAEGVDEKVDLRHIYSKIKLDKNVDRVPDDHRVCRFCLELVNDNASMSVRPDVDLVAILQNFFVEMDLRMTDDIIACTPCYNSLRFHVSFVKNYLGIEYKIDEYCKVEGTVYKGQVDLRDVATFISKSKLYGENISSLIIKDDRYQNIVYNNVDVKVKFEDSTDMEEEKENLVDREVQQSNNNSFQHHPSPSQSDSVPQSTRGKPATYMDVSEIEMHKCEVCPFETKLKSYLQKHLLSHQNTPDVITRGTTYKCDLCNYKAKWKSYLQKHMLTHKTHSEITMYKCDLCDYKTKRKSDLKKHMLTHKTHSETTMYKCEACTYETKHKSCLQQHTLIHMDRSKIDMYKCEVCPYETKWKKNLRQHLISHKKTPDVVTCGTIYKCELCNYETKQKAHLKRHMLTHKTHSEITMYKCDLCDYEAKQKSYLKRHMLIHKTHSEIVMFKCDLCDYKTKRKPDLKQHMLTHKTHSETTMFKCEACAYKTKRKNYLQQHMLTHMDGSKIEMHKCRVCPFQTKWKRYLRQHMLSHRNTPDVVT